MSKYDPLWKWINKNKTDDFKLTYAEIENIVGVPILSWNVWKVTAMQQ